MSTRERPEHESEEEVETYSTSEAAMLAGISYRQLDYWLRTGTVGFCNSQSAETPGSGRPRRWTVSDVTILCEIVARWREADAIVTAFRSGAMWREAADERCGG